MRAISQQIPIEEECKAVIVISTNAGRVATNGPIRSLEAGCAVYFYLDSLQGVTHPAREQSDSTLE